MKEKTGYEEALDRVIKVRLERKKQYGDGWKFTEDWELLGICNQKLSRLKDIILNKRKQFYETEIDTLIDLTNYSLFLLQNKLDKKNKK